MTNDQKLCAVTAFFQDTAKTSTIGSISIKEEPNIALASLAKRNHQSDSFEEVAQKLFGFDLPAPGHMETGKVWSSFWTGPDQWFLLAPFASHEMIAVSLQKDFGSSASITEQTDAWCIVEITGKNCFDLFKRLTTLDIETMETGKATRTTIEHLGCFVTCLAAGEKYHVFGPRSSANSLVHALEEAAYSIA